MEQQQPPSVKRARYSIKEPAQMKDEQLHEEALVEFNDCFILKQSLSFLGDSLTDVGKVMLVCRSWRNVAVACEPLWTSLLLQRYPNLKQAQLGTENIRNLFLRRLQLDCDRGAPVRKQAWPSTLRTPSARLIEMWKPTSILFLVDVQIDSVRVASVSRRVQLAQGGSAGKLLIPVTKKRREHDPNFISTRVNNLKGDVADAAEGLAKDSKIPCKVLLSYQLEGDQVPPHRPIVLLSEHEWTMLDGRKTYQFRTDVSGELSDHSYDHYVTYEQKKASDELKKRDICRYDTSPLPFDPIVDARVSPRNSVKECSLQIGIDFHTPLEVYDFPTKIFPTLLSLWEDATRA